MAHAEAPYCLLSVQQLLGVSGGVAHAVVTILRQAIKQLGVEVLVLREAVAGGARYLHPHSHVGIGG